jgi:Uma2 family endonuclease
MSTVLPTELTADDLLTMLDGDRYELIDGGLKELHMSQDSSWVAGKILRILGPFEDAGIGWVFPEGTSYQCFPWDPNRIRRADASFIRRERLPQGPTDVGHTRIAPDLAVEVVSPHDSVYDVDEKVADYLEAGVGIVWVANPHQRTVTIYRLQDPSSPTRLKESDELRGEEALQGFSCQVGDLFPPIGDQPASIGAAARQHREAK